MPTSIELAADLAREEARQRQLELRIGEEEDALAREALAMARERRGGARPARAR